MPTFRSNRGRSATLALAVLLAAGPAAGVPAAGVPAAGVPAAGVPAAGVPAAGVPAAGRLVDSIEVGLVEVDVWVSDRRGRPVGGLARDDFEVLVDGAAAEITHFHAAGPGADDLRPVVTERPPLQLALYVDSANVEAHQRNGALGHVRELLRARVGPGDRVLVASADRSSLAAHHPFTDRLDRIERALDEIERTAAQDRLSAEFREILRDIEVSLTVSAASVQGRLASIEARIRAFSAEAARDTVRAAGNLRRLVDTVAALPGRKAILYLGGGLSLHPGEALSHALAQALGRYATSLPGDEPAVEMPGGSFEDGSAELLAVARQASVSGVELHAVVGDVGLSASAGLSRSSTEGGSGTAAGQEESWAPGVGFSRSFDLGGSLELLAATTGGLAVTGGRDVRPLLARLVEGARPDYSLGIEPPAGDRGGVHRLEVKVRGRGREVRHRRAFRVKSGDQAAAERTLEALLAGAGDNPLEIRLAAGEAQPAERGLFSVPVSVQVPVAALAVAARGQAHVGQVSIFLTSGDGALVTGPVTKAVFPVTLDNAELLDAMGRMADYRVQLTMPGGRGTIAVGVRDDLDPRLSVQTLDVVVGETVSGPGS